MTFDDMKVQNIIRAFKCLEVTEMYTTQHIKDDKLRLHFFYIWVGVKEQDARHHFWYQFYQVCSI